MHPDRMFTNRIRSALMIAAAAASLGAGAPLPQSAEETRPLAVGARAPDAKVRTLEGEEVSLAKLLDGQRAAVIFYRGGWCPYCNAHLSQLKKAETELLDSGFRLYALSADRPEALRESSEKYDFSYTLLSDASLDAARAYGIAFQVDADTVEQYKRYGIDLEAASGEKHHGLPVPSVFLIDAGGVIRFVHAEPDYKTRLAPAELRAAMDRVAAN